MTEQNTAAALGSGGLDVYATPAMALLMEKTCYLCAQGALEAGRTTVGTAPVSYTHPEVYKRQIPRSAGW